jgi:hypothetical protein
MQKRTLIFDDSVEGHHLEFIHHLYEGASKIKNEEFIFILHPDFQYTKKKLFWNSCTSITIEFISEKDIKLLKKTKLVKSYLLCRILKKATKKYNVTNVFLISLMSFMPFIPFFFNKKIKISGIIYLIYLYRWYNLNLQSRVFDVVKYIIFSQSKIFSNIFLLNDNIAPIYLNRKFKSKVFKYLPDPFMPPPKGELKNLRDDLNIPTEKNVFFHFGALSERKGTIEILKAIIDSDEFKMKNCCFVFAGKISEDIKETFYTILKKAELKTQIIIFDEFCDYNFIGSLCLTSDFLLIPYKESAQSSGVLGYANQFKIPIVGPRTGLIGKLIKRYKMGVLLEDCSSVSLKTFFNNIENINLKINTNYIDNRKVSIFINTILNTNYLNEV